MTRTIEAIERDIKETHSAMCNGWIHPASAANTLAQLRRELLEAQQCLR